MTAPKPNKKRALPLVTQDRRSPGRPYVLTQKGREELTKLARAGLERPTIAAALGIADSTLGDMLKRDPTAEEAYTRGRAGLSDELAHILLSQARSGNVVAAIFLAKARCGWREGDPPESRPNVTINLPAAADPDTYRKMIDVTPAAPDPTTEANPERNKP